MIIHLPSSLWQNHIFPFCFLRIFLVAFWYYKFLLIVVSRTTFFFFCFFFQPTLLFCVLFSHLAIHKKKWKKWKPSWDSVFLLKRIVESIDIYVSYVQLGSHTLEITHISNATKTIRKNHIKRINSMIQLIYTHTHNILYIKQLNGNEINIYVVIVRANRKLITSQWENFY